MRVTQSMYYKNLYGTSHSDLSTKLFDVNKQIASGSKIQYAKDNVAIFTETMRLDNEITTLQQVKKSTQSAYKVSNQTDVVLNEFELSMNRVRTLLIQASNGTNDNVSQNAIAKELRGIEEHIVNLANTSINGQYLFSGTATNTKPIGSDGTYYGNAGTMNAFLGSQNKQQFNISGAELFLGEEVQTNKTITANVVQSLNNPALEGISQSSSMEEFMGLSPYDTHYFYVQGVQSDGTSFNKQITMSNNDTIKDLMTQVGNAYGNTLALDVVNVSLNLNGQFVIEDKIKGSSKLDFHMLGATDFNGAGADTANVTNLDTLDNASTDYGVASTGLNLYVREFMQSGFTQSNSVNPAGNNIEGLLYDRTQFSIDGNTLSSNVAQVSKGTNAFAGPSTKIIDVASGNSLDTKVFQLSGTDVAGTAFDVQINFLNTGSTFSVGGNTYDIFDVGTPRAAVSADSMTYQQMMDVMNMVMTNNLPASHNGLGNNAQEANDYDQAIINSNAAGTTSLSYDGKLQFGDLTASTTKASIAIHDVNSGNFAQPASVLSFNANNALTIRDSKTDFFKTIDAMINSVENHIIFPNSTVGAGRDVGIENAIAMMDDLQDHVFSSHSRVGANSNALTISLQRTETLEISTKTLRSQVIDTDLAEASLALTQLTLNYEAMLSTVSRVSKLSLVNYL